MKDYQRAEWLREKYWDEGLSLFQIGHLVNRSHVVILRQMKRHDIPRRTLSAAKQSERNPMWGKKHTVVTLCKMAEIKRGKKATIKTRQKMSLARRGKKFSLEHRRKLGESKRGEKNPQWKGGRHHVTGYIRLTIPGHPNADAKGYIYEHRFVMAECLGRPLRVGETVHHINGIRDDNRRENLELFATGADHSGFHAAQMQSTPKELIFNQV